MQVTNPLTVTHTNTIARLNIPRLPAIVYEECSMSSPKLSERIGFPRVSSTAKNVLTIKKVKMRKAIT